MWCLSYNLVVYNHYKVHEFSRSYLQVCTLNISSISSPTPVLGNHHFTFCFHELSSFMIPCKSNIILVSFWFVLLSTGSSGSTCVVAIAAFSFFSWLNNNFYILLFMYYIHFHSPYFCLGALRLFLHLGYYD